MVKEASIQNENLQFCKLCTRQPNSELLYFFFKPIFLIFWFYWPAPFLLAEFDIEKL